MYLLLKWRVFSDVVCGVTLLSVLNRLLQLMMKTRELIYRMSSLMCLFPEIIPVDSCTKFHRRLKTYQFKRPTSWRLVMRKLTTRQTILTCRDGLKVANFLVTSWRHARLSRNKSVTIVGDFLVTFATRKLRGTGSSGIWPYLSSDFTANVLREDWHNVI